MSRVVTARTRGDAGIVVNADGALAWAERMRSKSGQPATGRSIYLGGTAVRPGGCFLNRRTWE